MDDAKLGLRYELNGYQMVAWIQTEVQSGKACGIWVGYAPGDGYVTGWYRCGDTGWNDGHYQIKDKALALLDAMQRAGLAHSRIKPMDLHAVIKCG
jgi:hypothetical protein